MIHTIINMTPYTVMINSIFLGSKERIRIPSSGVITFMAVSSPAAFGDLSVWEPETFVLSGVPEKLDDEAVYIVTPGVEEALRAAGYDMSRFRLVNNAVFHAVPDGSSGERRFIEGNGLARIA